MRPENPKIPLIAQRCAEISTELQRLVPHHQGTFSVTISNEGDFHLELYGESGAEGGYAPTQKELPECMRFVLYDPSVNN